MTIYERAKSIALAQVQAWLPGGYVEGGQWVVKNPTRHDRRAGSFKINLTTGAWNDYADDDAVGSDAISLYGYLNGLSNYDAANEILARYDPSYFPGKDDIKKSDTWHQLTRSHRDAPDLPPQRGEVMRWPLEIKCGQSWRVVMWIIRFVHSDGKKLDLPMTLWTDGKVYDWRKKALHGVKYPLYGLRGLIERPNARVVLYEGQKCPSVVQPVLGDDWVAVGWYGGAGNTHLTDWDPLIGREVWLSFDADGAGRKAIKTILDTHMVKAHMVYPPPGVATGWDHADAVTFDGWGKTELETVILADTSPAVQVTAAPENRPQRLEVEVSQEWREYVLDNIYIETQDKKGDVKYVTRPDWFFWICQEDQPIRNSIKYDYTTGTKATAYDSTDIYDANLEFRLRNLGIPANLITKSVKERMCGEILRMNSSFNRVADYIDTLIIQHPDTTDSVLDEFMSVLQFRADKNKNESADAYEARFTKVERHYRELFDKFFLRMHGRIKGTRKDENGEFMGLLENDIVPILEGPQEIGKTTLCRWLACDDELYIDLGSGLKQGFGSAETVKKIRGRLIAEIGEMKIMKNSDAVETIKSFISMKSATVDIKYVENQRDIPMTASFIGTSNPEQYLSDDTGNRRFWPVKLQGIDKDLIAKNHDLPMRLHAHYQKKALSMTKQEIYAACLPSKELRDFIEILRRDALITYSDYEVCLRIIKQWKEDNPLGGTYGQAELEKAALGLGYPSRISQRSFKQAMKDTGFYQERIYDANVGRAILTWCWPKKDDEIPF